MPDVLPPICADCEDHGDGSYTCDPDRPACRYRVRPYDDLTPAPSPAAEPPHDLREALVRWLAQRYSDGSALEMRGIRDDTDALLAGPLAPLLAKLRAVERAMETAPVMRFDNDYPVKAVPVAELLSTLTAALSPESVQS